MMIEKNSHPKVTVSLSLTPNHKFIHQEVIPRPHGEGVRHKRHMVEAARFELETFRTSSERSNQLSYAS